MTTTTLVPQVEAEHRFVPRGDLPPIAQLNCQKPDPGFVASVAAQQLHPVGLLERTSSTHNDNRYQVIYGNRRIYAAHLAELRGLNAYIYQAGDVNPLLMTITENHQRKPNPLSDYDAILPMLASRTIEEVAVALHLPVGVVWSAWKLSELEPSLLQLARTGNMALGTAVILACKPKSVQNAVRQAYDEGERITKKVVKRCSTAVAQETAPVLPIPNIPGAPGVQFGRALDTERGVKLVFYQDGERQDFLIPATKLYQLLIN